MIPTLEHVEAPQFEEAFFYVERHEGGVRAFSRSFRRESEALREARYQRSLDARPDELLVVFAMVFAGDEWVASREVACWRGVRCRVRASAKTRWDRIAAASEAAHGTGGAAPHTAARIDGEDPRVASDAGASATRESHR